MIKSYQAVLVTIVCIFWSCQPSNPTVQKTTLNSGTEALLQAISYVDAGTVWVSGHNATFARSTDSGESWEIFTHPSDTLQFRDLHAFDQNHIVLMSAGPGASSQILHFYPEEKLWDTAYIMPHEEGFLNTIEFWPGDSIGLAFGDSFGGQMFVLKTIDYGRTWNRIDPKVLPLPEKGEGGFAASGTCVSTVAGGTAYIGTGAGGSSKVMKTTDYGKSWFFTDGPLPTGNAAGIFSIRMLFDGNGIVAGGDLSQPEAMLQNVAVTKDGGINWVSAPSLITPGTFYGSDIIQTDLDDPFIIASGPSGIDYSFDMGTTWHNLDTGHFWCVKMHPSGYGLATGKKGQIIKITLE